jgi:hypothetical protein
MQRNSARRHWCSNVSTQIEQNRTTQRAAAITINKMAAIKQKQSAIRQDDKRLTDRWPQSDLVVRKLLLVVDHVQLCATEQSQSQSQSKASTRAAQERSSFGLESNQSRMKLQESRTEHQTKAGPRDQSKRRTEESSFVNAFSRSVSFGPNTSARANTRRGRKRAVRRTGQAPRRMVWSSKKR